ncbi:hypothetical protein FUT87_07430 [Mitsuaria sp. TWR114]|uniref:small multi-drug export protein n=1 Tax=Mitsuaria sp. TWR114 TaxID=2601731 RepID=UPI0011BF8C29|nr:small multi-drug export protein [Mitsuaria sp. TWR114]TXD94233.1 hypothetical protein FUT87_07430 [Mitsuaria sp. TWR114]
MSVCASCPALPAIPAGIDTSAMLTMAGLIAAVWSVVPATTKLSFRLGLSWLDWAIIWSLLGLIHVFFFEPVLRWLHLFPVLGPWKWGFDKSVLQYSLFLALVGFVYIRSRRTEVSRWKLPLFEKLAMALLHGRRFEELAGLLDRHLDSVLELACREGIRRRLANWLRPTLVLPMFTRGANGNICTVDAPMSRLAKLWRAARDRAAHAMEPSEKVRGRAQGILTSLLSSRKFAAYLALAHPYLCLRIMQRVTRHVEDFQDECFVAFLEDEGSVLYAEIKNSEQLAGQQGHRLDLPEENRLLRFYLSDVSVAGNLGVFRSIGEAALARIEVDDVLMGRLNGPLFRYQEVGCHRCPIYTSIYFFRIMVLEGLHQRSNDHLWLHYAHHFAEKLLSRARPVQPSDEIHEFPTPLAYLLYCLVDVACDWIEDAMVLTQEGDVIQDDVQEGRHVYISFEATTALGAVLEPIILSDRVPDRLKSELLEVVLNSLKRVQGPKRLAELAGAMCRNVITPHGFRGDARYLALLRYFFDRQDHVLRGDVRRFDDALAEAESTAR